MAKKTYKEETEAQIKNADAKTASVSGGYQGTKSNGSSENVQSSNTDSYSESLGESVSNSSGTSRSYRTLTPEGQQAIEQGVAEARKAYEPTTFDALGVKREALQAERERQMKNNRLKQMQAALFNSGALIADMISAGVGGNVWKREKDTTAADAVKDTERLRALQAAEEAAEAERLRKERAEQFEAGERARKAYYDMYNQAVNETSQRHEGITSNQQQGSTSTTGLSRQTTHQDSQTNTSQWGQQGTTYADALKGAGLSGVSSSAGASLKGGGSHSGVDYLPIRIVDGANGASYVSFAMAGKEKEAISHAISSEIDRAVDAGDKRAKALRKKYFTKQQTDGSVTWDYDGLLDDGALYQIPTVLNMYLDKLVKTGMTYTNERGEETPYTRSMLYDMMTGDREHKNVPAGVNLGTSRL